MAISRAELQAKLDSAPVEVTNARPGIDAFVAEMVTLRQQLADAIANAVDLTDAAASVDAILAKHQEGAQALVDGMAATPPVVVP